MNAAVTFPELSFRRQTPTGFKADLRCLLQARTIVMEAESMGIAWRIIPFSPILAFTYNNVVRYVRNGSAPTNGVVGHHVCAEKYLTRVLLMDNAIPVPKGFVVMRQDTLEDRTKIFDALQKPLVVKPGFGTDGNGVKMGITTKEAMHAWIDHLLATIERDTSFRRGMVMVEETVIGNEYRIIATRDHVVAVMNRQPASVVGDGKKTIQELIAEKNKDPMRNINETLYPHITMDADMREVLADQQLNEQYVPDAGQKVQLRRISNIMAGGDAVDMTDAIHPSVAEIAVRVCRAIPDMSLVGIDYMTTDITKDQQFEQHAVIEVNSAPEYTMHDYPMIGKKRGVAREILKMMFPEWTEHTPE